MNSELCCLRNVDRQTGTPTDDGQMVTHLRGRRQTEVVRSKSNAFECSIVRVHTKSPLDRDGDEVKEVFHFTQHIRRVKAVQNIKETIESSSSSISIKEA
jgi:hypothetical protein